MSKRASLAGAISAAAHGKATAAPKPKTKAAPEEEPEPRPKTDEKPAEKAAAPKRAPSRVGKKAVYGWVDPAVHRSLRTMNLDTGRSVDELVGEAVRDMLKKNGYLK